MMRRAALASLALCLSAGIAAAGTPDFQAPQGCETFLTVQSLSCTVTHYYHCSVQPGDVWATVYTAEGALSTTHEDAETVRIDSIALGTGATFTTLQPIADPASLSTLLATGSDDWSYDQVLRDGLRVRHHGIDRLTGERVVIDGEELQMVSTSYQTRSLPDERVLVTGTATLMILERLRLALMATEHRTGHTADWTRDTTPVDFAYPGEAGFLSTTPITDFGAPIGALPQTRSFG